MIKVNNTKTIICSKKELQMIHPFCNSYYTHMYELPLFGLTPKDFQYHNLDDLKSDYILLRTVNSKLSLKFMNDINTTWSKLYEG